MPLIAYQSFNANSSKEHGLAATSLQQFTKQTNTHVTQKKHKALVLPSDARNLATPIEGPANLVPVKPLPDKKRKRGDDNDGKPAAKRVKSDEPLEQTGPVFGSHISSMFQHFFRQFGKMPSILVCGEFDTSHPDFSDVVGSNEMEVEAHPSQKACQSFSSFSPSANGNKCVAEGNGYVVYSVSNMNIVFVHVPNAIAKKKEATKKFYKDIAQELLSNGKIIHLVIGDTNQGSADYTKQALNDAFATTAYTNALQGKTVTKIDNYNVKEGGTNAKGTQLYDVAVYRSDVVELKTPVAYISQSSNAVTVTDHCGLAVSIEVKKAV